MQPVAADIVREGQALAVRVDTADISAVDLDYHLGSGPEQEAIFLPLELLRQIDIGGDERRAVGGEIHISPPERTRLVVIEFKIHLGNLPSLSDGEARYLVFLAVNMPLEPAEAQIYPLLRPHAPAFNFNMRHKLASLILKIRLLSDANDPDLFAEVMLYALLYPRKAAIEYQTLGAFALKQHSDLAAVTADIGYLAAVALKAWPYVFVDVFLHGITP